MCCVAIVAGPAGGGVGVGQVRGRREGRGSWVGWGAIYLALHCRDGKKRRNRVKHLLSFFLFTMWVSHYLVSSVSEPVLRPENNWMKSFSATDLLKILRLTPSLLLLLLFITTCNNKLTKRRERRKTF